MRLKCTLTGFYELRERISEIRKIDDVDKKGIIQLRTNFFNKDSLKFKSPKTNFCIQLVATVRGSIWTPQIPAPSA